MFRWSVPVLDPGFLFLTATLLMNVQQKRFSITGKSSADKRARVVSGDLPTPKRWKTSVPQVTGLFREEVGLLPNLFPRLGVWLSLSDARDLSLQDKVSDAFSHLQHWLQSLHVGSPGQTCARSQLTAPQPPPVSPLPAAPPPPSVSLAVSHG